jgi:hypothetical protein
MIKRAISRHFGIARDSVDKMIVYSVPPGYRRTAPIRRPKLDVFTEIIDRLLRVIFVRTSRRRWCPEVGVQVYSRHADWHSREIAAATSSDR